METQTKSDGWTKFAVFQLYGFYFVGKYFALLAGPLIVTLVFNRSLCQRVYTSLVRRNSLSLLSWTLLISIMYGICEVTYGILSDYNPVTAFQVLVFNFCPIYLFLGMWAGERKPTVLRTWVRFIAWYQAIYTVLYFSVFRNMNSDFLGQPGSGSTTLLGLFSFEANLGGFWFPILVATFTMIANQVRADWAGFAMALLIWGVAAKRLGRIATIVGIVASLLLIGLIFDLRMPGLPGRGGEVSARDTVGRALSSFMPDLAKEYTRDASTYAGTVKWRENWWKEIRDTVDQRLSTRIFGMGYGYPIADLVPYLKGSDLRTPHSIFYFTLCYSGYVGVLLFFSLQACIFLLHWQTFLVTGQIYGLILNVSLLTSAFFGNFFEAPQIAIPTYILLGIAIGPLFAKTQAGVARPQVVTLLSTKNYPYRREDPQHIS